MKRQPVVYPPRSERLLTARYVERAEQAAVLAARYREALRDILENEAAEGRPDSRAAQLAREALK